MKTVVLSMLLAVTAAHAQTDAAAIAYPTVAAAQKALEARDGDGTIVTHPDGWVVINEPAAAAQWSFTTPGHEAHPAVVKRVIQRSAGNKVAVLTSTLCEAPAAACAKLKAEFEAMNDRITQATQSRGRTPPPVAPR